MEGGTRRKLRRAHGDRSVQRHRQGPVPRGLVLLCVPKPSEGFGRTPVLLWTGNFAGLCSVLPGQWNSKLVNQLQFSLCVTWMDPSHSACLTAREFMWNMLTILEILSSKCTNFCHFWHDLPLPKADVIYQPDFIQAMKLPPKAPKIPNHRGSFIHLQIWWQLTTSSAVLHYTALPLGCFFSGSSFSVAVIFPQGKRFSVQIISVCLPGGTIAQLPTWCQLSLRSSREVARWAVLLQAQTVYYQHEEF
jgi:hypothetical protein